MWKESYLIGISHVDKQHKRLFEMVDDLNELLAEPGNEAEKREKGKEAVVFMKAYAIMHFDAEEEYQRKIGYKDYEQHKKMHDDFKNAINGYEQKLIACNYEIDKVKEFADILENWLDNHVTKEDQRLKG